MRKIIIIEDNTVVAELYAKKLRAAGNDVTVAHDGVAGLRLIYDLRPDLVLLDLMLPGKSGVDIIKEIRQNFRYSNLPIMAYSSADEWILAQAVEAGSTSIISKNEASFKEIFEQFNELLEVSRNWQIYNPYNFDDPITGAAPAPGGDPADHDPTLLDWATLRPAAPAPRPEPPALAPAAEPVFAETVAIEPFRPAPEFGAPPAPAAPPRRLLIVEDDLLTSCILSGIAEAQGLEPVTVADGHEAYELMMHDADFVAVVLDVELPRIKGTELLKFMRRNQRLRHLPVVVMTASSDYIRLQIESYESGATCFISKPFERPMIQSLFQTLLKT